MSVGPLDLAIVAHQLGRASAADLHPVSRVVARCPWDLPAAVECLPYDRDGRPFPTLFYATCPTLTAAVGRLEDSGGVAALSAVAARDHDLGAALGGAERYERRRRRDLARGPGAAGAVRARDGGAVLSAGVGGTTGALCGASVKCLHAHAAHALAQPGYTLGALILEQAALAAGSLWCDDARCQHLPQRSLDPAEESVRVAAIDLGTNTCRLLLAEASRTACGPLRTEHRESRVVRLGQGVDETGRLHPQAVMRARDCLADYARQIEAFAPRERMLFSTSAVRDAADGREFLEAVRRDLSLPWRILSGDAEGTLAFRAAACAAAGIDAVLLVLDIGGGSTEFCVGRPGSVPFVRSIDMGAVRLTERFFRHDPPTIGEWTAAVRHVRGLIREHIPVDVRASARVGFGLAGTIATLCANKLRLTRFRRELIEGHPLALADIDAAIAQFRRLTSAQRLELPGVQPGREDVILAGSLIAREACRAFSLPGFRYASHDVLEGQALELAYPTLEPAGDRPA